MERPTPVRPNLTRSMNPSGAATAIPMTIGVIGGTLSSFFASFQYADLTETIILSALGATISFVVSALLEWVVKQIKQRFAHRR
jgi:hypothetical protein